MLFMGCDLMFSAKTVPRMVRVLDGLFFGDIHHIMDWGSKFGLDAAILELQQNGSIEDRTLWDKLLGERGAKSSP